MNDQRKIIFGQRIEILKNSDIKKMILSFLEELNKNLELAHQNFTKSNDLKVFSNELNQVTEMLLMTKKFEEFSKMNTKEITKSFEIFL